MGKPGLIFILLFIICLPLINGQDDKTFKAAFLEAEYFFLMEEYDNALFHYSELLKTDPDNYNLQFLTGACYLSLYGQKHKAIPYLENAVQSITAAYREGSYKEHDAPREALFALARAYHIDNQFAKAIEYYEKYRNAMFKQKFADIEYVNNQIKSCELARSMISNPIEVSFLDMGEDLNRYPSNYNPVFSGNDSVVIYMADKPLSKAILMSEKSAGHWTEPRLLNDEIGSDNDCYPTSLSFNGKELYLVKTDHFEADIYISRFENGDWTKIEKLNHNINTDYLESHACISSDGNELYFTSDRPGGQGTLDIWVSERTGGSDWGPATNLGPDVNSFYSEETPFITSDGKKLYLSSQGHATMGGYDIFCSTWLEDGKWSFPVNIGYPVSTSDDDLFFVPRRDGRWAYYSTIRDTLPGKRNIYALRFGKQEDVRIGVRKIEEEIIDTLGEVDITSVKVEESGVTTGMQVSPDEYYVLNSILFEFNSYSLDEKAMREADRILEVLQKYPDIRIELTGHADAIGTDEYNIKLSKERAEAVGKYLTYHGINNERITTKGIGEAEPLAINQYEDGTDSPEGRRLNRHVSVKFSNLQDVNVKVAEIFVPENLRPKSELTFSVLLVISDTIIHNIPDQVGEEQIALIITDRSYLYTTGNFDRKADAMRFLNEALDNGFPDAMIMEQEGLEELIKSLSGNELPVSITFTIQVMALRKPVDVDYFRNLGKVTMFLGNDGLHRYVYGEFEDISEALKELPRIRNMGYEDAFIMYLARYKRNNPE